MSYKIEGFYCEKLNISQYLNNMLENHAVKVNIDFKTKLFQKEEKEFSLKIYYVVESDFAPISLNWVGVVNIVANDDNIELDDKQLLKDDEVKKFIENSISGFSGYFHGELPPYDLILENVK